MKSDAGIKGATAAAAAAAGVTDIEGPFDSAVYSQDQAAASSVASGIGSSSAGSGHGSEDHLAPIFRSSPSGDSSDAPDSAAPSCDARSGNENEGEGAPQPWKEEEDDKPRPESCVKYFDELWFCYSALLHHRVSLGSRSARHKS